MNPVSQVAHGPNEICPYKDCSLLLVFTLSQTHRVNSCTNSWNKTVQSPQLKGFGGRHLDFVGSLLMDKLCRQDSPSQIACEEGMAKYQHLSAPQKRKCPGPCPSSPAASLCSSQLLGTICGPLQGSWSKAHSMPKVCGPEPACSSSPSQWQASLKGY